MDFEFEDRQYKLARGESTGRWLLLLLNASGNGWALIDTLDASIRDRDILDHAKTILKQKDTNDERP